MPFSPSTRLMAAMGQKPSQNLRQQVAHKQVMAPQLVQSIKLLQMSHRELLAHVTRELEENPFLEREDAPLLADEGAFTPYKSLDKPPLRKKAGHGLAPSAGGAEANYQAKTKARLKNDASDKPAGHIEQLYANASSLQQKLEEQIALMARDPKLRLICRHLIGQLDEAGYLRIDAKAVCAQLSIAQAELEQGVKLLQACEPTGIGARNLKECLQLQLEERGLYDGKMAILLDNLDLLARGGLPALAGLCGVGEEALQQMAGYLRSLDPKPGEVFEGAEPQSRIPDVFVYPAASHGWKVQLNPDLTPSLLPNETYYQSVSKGAKGKEKAFLSSYMQSAKSLVKALDQRAKTILRVAQEIVRIQSPFLRHGVMCLKPMSLKQVAQALGLHESTVSRVTAHKYMATPQGVFEMKYFFGSGLAAASGQEVYSSKTVRHQIHRMIEEEDCGRVLSDGAIVKRLRTAGVEIARRTVAKYREDMNIPSSIERRRQKKHEHRGLYPSSHD